MRDAPMSANVKSTKILTTDAVFDLLKLAVPVAASRLAMPIMSLTDAVVLGRMAQLELPYITTGYLVFSVGFALGMGILQGVQVITAELSGVGKGSESGRVLRRGLWTGVALGGVFTILSLIVAGPLFKQIGFSAEAVDGMTSAAHILAYGLTWQLIATGAGMYLEALRKPLLVVFVMYACAALNLVFDLAFVVGYWGLPQMGADGVAWASTGVRIFQAIALIILVAIFTPGFRKSPPAPAGEFRRQNTVGLGGAIANVAEFTAFNITFVIAAMVSLSAGTIYSLSVQPIFTCFMIFNGIAVGASVRVAESFGRKEYDQVKNASRLGVLTYILVGLVLCVLLYAFRDPMARAMVAQDGELNLAPALAIVIGISALALMFDGLQVVGAMILRAQEVVWASTSIQLASYFAIMVPAAWYLGYMRQGGASGVMWAVVLGSIVAGLGQVALLELKTARNQKLRAAYQTNAS